MYLKDVLILLLGFTPSLQKYHCAIVPLITNTCASTIEAAVQTNVTIASAKYAGTHPSCRHSQ